VAIWSTENGNLLRFIGQSSRLSNDLVMSHDGKWFISLEDNLYRSTVVDYRSVLEVITVGRYYQVDNNLYGYQSRVCYNFERSGNPQMNRSYSSSSVPLGVTYLGEVEPIIFNMCDAYSGAQIRNLVFPMPENVMIDRTRKTWNTRFASDFQLSHDDSMLVAIVDSNIFMWDTASGDIIQIITRDESLKTVGFSTNDHVLVYHNENTVFIWDIKQQTWAGTHVIAGKISRVVMSDTNRIVATVEKDNQWSIIVIDLSI